MRRMGPKAERIPLWAIEQLLLDNEKRGLDSTGVAVGMGDGKVEVVKCAESAWRFLKTQEWGRFVRRLTADELFVDDVVSVLGHCRKASVGGAWKTENNHPVFSGKTAVTHNGGVRNHEWIFKELKLPRKAEVDSDAIRAILDECGLTPEAFKTLNRLSGPAAVAAVSTDFPDRLMLLRSGSPLVVAALPQTGHLVWSSRKESIHRVSRRWWSGWGGMTFTSNRADLVICPFQLDTGIIVQGDRQIFSGAFTANSGIKHELTYTCHESFPNGRKEVVEKKGEETARRARQEGIVVLADRTQIPCRKKGCGAIVELWKEDMGVSLTELRCPDCKTVLSGGEA